MSNGDDPDPDETGAAPPDPPWPPELVLDPETIPPTSLYYRAATEEPFPKPAGKLNGPAAEFWHGRQPIHPRRAIIALLQARTEERYPPLWALDLVANAFSRWYNSGGELTMDAAFNLQTEAPLESLSKQQLIQRLRGLAMKEIRKLRAMLCVNTHQAARLTSYRLEAHFRVHQAGAGAPSIDEQLQCSIHPVECFLFQAGVAPVSADTLEGYYPKSVEGQQAKAAPPERPNVEAPVLDERELFYILSGYPKELFDGPLLSRWHDLSRRFRKHNQG